MTRFESAKEMYASYGVDDEATMKSALKHLLSLRLLRSAQGFLFQSQRHSFSSIEAKIISPQGES